MSSIIVRKNDIPEIINDPETSSAYRRLRFLGKGGFAKVYEIKDIASNQIYAVKIVSKKKMRSVEMEKMAEEISIHRSLLHRHVVGFHSFFEDTLNVYILLELCKNRSLMELHKRRAAITELETRFFMKEILLGVQYLHRSRIIHRDLKLDNILLDNDLRVKIADFGIAARIEHEGERKRCVCGTPNYIAPEILLENGHSYEVDVWSLGCIMFTLLVGKTPFESPTLQETYNKIKIGDYSIPRSLSKPAVNMIQRQLRIDPEERPAVDLLLQDQFFTSGLMPAALPVTCLTTAPRTDQLERMSRQRRPLRELNGEAARGMAVASSSKYDIATSSRAPEPAALNPRQNLIALRGQLSQLLVKTPVRPRSECLTDEQSDPAAQPLVWMSKWVDKSDKYGFGYQLCDDTVGFVFNDGTQLIMLPNGRNIHYIDQHSLEQYMTQSHYPEELGKKINVLVSFQRYMTEKLEKTGASVGVRDSDSLSRSPHLHQWLRTPPGVVMYLTNGTLQVNFEDHSKIILCPLMQAVTYIDVEKNFRTFRFSTIKKYGYDAQLYKNLTYALDKIEIMITIK